MPFSERLQAAVSSKMAARGLLLQPALVTMPLPMLREDDPFLPWGKAIIGAVHDLVCVVVFDLAAYMALGAAGMVALERTAAYACASGDVLTVLHGPFATGDFVAAAGSGAFNVDGVTVSSPALIDVYDPGHDGGIFVYNPPTGYRGTRFVLADASAHLYHIQVGMITLATDQALDASRGEDFADAARAAVLRL
jgi:hypothetical protein